MNPLGSSPATWKLAVSPRTVVTGRCRVGAAMPSRFVPAFALVIAMAFAALAGIPNRARAQNPGWEKGLVPVPTSGIEVEFWSDPAAGSLVQPGGRARLYARTNADCYLTVFSVDTEGRMRLLYPRSFEKAIPSSRMNSTTVR